MSSASLRKAENSASNVRAIIVLSIVVVIVGTGLLTNDAPAEFKPPIIAVGVVTIFSQLLLLYMWESIYHTLAHIGNPTGESIVEDNTTPSHDTTPIGTRWPLSSGEWECQYHCGFYAKDKNALFEHESICSPYLPPD